MVKILNIKYMAEISQEVELIIKIDAAKTRVRILEEHLPFNKKIKYSNELKEIKERAYRLNAPRSKVEELEKELNLTRSQIERLEGCFISDSEKEEEKKCDNDFNMIREMLIRDAFSNENNPLFADPLLQDFSPKQRMEIIQIFWDYQGDL
jgi:hypothetical protein